MFLAGRLMALPLRKPSLQSGLQMCPVCFNKIQVSTISVWSLTFSWRSDVEYNMNMINVFGRWCSRFKFKKVNQVSAAMIGNINLKHCGLCSGFQSKPYMIDAVKFHTTVLYSCLQFLPSTYYMLNWNCEGPSHPLWCGRNFGFLFQYFVSYFPFTTGS